jgi:hypothetical protein
MAAPGGLIALLGAIVLLEINYRLATAPEAGTKMKLFGIGIDAATPWPWIVAVAFLVGGSFACRWTWPRVRMAWDSAVPPTAMDAVEGAAK